jgi:AraC-like DNA-binding protein
MVFPATWPDRAIDGADAKAARLARLALERALPAEPAPFSHPVQRVLHQMLVATSPSSDEMARLFAISPRALRLRLQAEATRFQQLLGLGRFALARQPVQRTGMDLAEVAAELHYADLPLCSRAFRKWSGMRARATGGWLCARMGRAPWVQSRSCRGTAAPQPSPTPRRQGLSGSAPSFELHGPGAATRSGAERRVIGPARLTRIDIPLAARGFA